MELNYKRIEKETIAAMNVIETIKRENGEAFSEEQLNTIFFKIHDQYFSLLQVLMANVHWLVSGFLILPFK